MPALEAGDHLLPDVLEDDPAQESGDAKTPDKVQAMVEKQLHKHRLEGHSTDHPDCEDCKIARGMMVNGLRFTRTSAFFRTSRYEHGAES